MTHSGVDAERAFRRSTGESLAELLSFLRQHNSEVTALRKSRANGFVLADDPRSIAISQGEVLN